MTFELPKLPYDMTALEPHISEETLEYHYWKHHAGYVKKLNAAIPGTSHEWKDLEEIIRSSEGWIFNNAAQIWNHTFYWNCLSPNGWGKPSGRLMNCIERDFWDYDTFADAFSKASATNFGSGWTWLVQTPEGKLEIDSTSNAGCVLTTANTPLMVIDVWEHAYYIDYRNARPGYIEAFWNLVNWDFVEGNMN